MKKISTIGKTKSLFQMDIIDQYIKHFSNTKTPPNPLNFFSFILPFIKKENHGLFRVIKKISDNGASYLPDMFMKNLIDGYIERKKYQEKTGIHLPPFLALTPLTDCNLSCKGCFASEHKKGASIKENDLRKILDFFQSNGTRFFTILGGEPLIYKNLIQILSEYKKSIFMLFTNSTLFNQNFFNEIKEARNIIPMISVDGNEEITDKRRGKGVYKKVINTVQNLISKKIPYGVSFTFTKSNFDELLSEKYLQTFESNFLVLATYIQFMDIGCSSDGDNNLSMEMQEKASRVLHEYKNNKNYVIGNIPQDEINLWGGCPSDGKGILHINANLNIEPCIFVHKSNVNLKTLDFNFDKALINNYQSTTREKKCTSCLAIKDKTDFYEIIKKVNSQETEHIFSNKAKFV